MFNAMLILSYPGRSKVMNPKPCPMNTSLTRPNFSKSDLSWCFCTRSVMFPTKSLQPGIGSAMAQFWLFSEIMGSFAIISCVLEWCRGQMIGPTVKMKVKGERACDKHKRIVLFFVEKQNVWKLETSSLLRFPSLPHRIMLPTVVFFATSAYIFMWHKNSSIFGIGDTATPTEQYHSIAISSNVCCSLEYQAVHMTELLIHPSGWINDERMAVHCLESGCIGLYIPPDLEISLGPRDVPRVSPSVYLPGLRKFLGRWGYTTQYIPPLGSVRIQSLPELWFGISKYFCH